MKSFKATSVVTLIASLLFLTAGCVGPKGDQGPPGAPGATTSDITATSGKIVSTINCSGTVSGTGYLDLEGLGVEYDAVLTSSGDVYATAVVFDEGYQASGTSFYASKQAGAQTGLVLVNADYVGGQNGGIWKVSLNRDTLVTKAIYQDPSVVGGSVEMTFTPSSCTSQNW
ncbi:hypothetical protein GW916_00995 [bacterium]|nr:hypothetical protein [bacterium]